MVAGPGITSSSVAQPVWLGCLGGHRACQLAAELPVGELVQKERFGTRELSDQAVGGVSRTRVSSFARLRVSGQPFHSKPDWPTSSENSRFRGAASVRSSTAIWIKLLYL